MTRHLIGLATLGVREARHLLLLSLVLVAALFGCGGVHDEGDSDETTVGALASSASSSDLGDKGRFGAACNRDDDCEARLRCVDGVCTPPGGGGCSQIAECYIQCESWETRCMDRCYIAGSRRARTAFEGLLKCFGSKCPSTGEKICPGYCNEEGFDCPR